MKKIAFCSVLFLMFFTIASCGGSNQEIEKEDALRNEVFAIHDAVMPRMSEIVKLKGKLRELPMDTTNEAVMRAAISQLEKAEEGMMDWMNKFKQPETLRETKSHEEIMQYLDGEKTTISQVRDDMNNSIQVAERLLGSSGL